MNSEKTISAATLAVAATLAATAAEPATANQSLHLSSLFQDHAVVQRGKRTCIWGGGATPFGRLDATLGKVRGAARATADGSFMFRLPAQEAGGPYVLEVKDESGEVVKAEDVYVGEVWLASGQSNMEFRMRSCEPGADPGDHPLIRQFGVRIEGANLPLHDVRGKWMLATENNIPDFGAVGYFFAQRLQKEFPGVAVGIVLSSLGGTSVISWTSRSALLENETGAALVREYENDSADVNIWDTTPQPVTDLGPAKCEEAGWPNNDFDDSSWQKIKLPNDTMASPECFGRRFNGAVWARKTLDIPARWAGRRLVLHGGKVDKHDVMYFSGEKIGASGFGFDEHFWNIERIYKIPAKLVKEGKAVLAIRAWSHLHGLSIHGTPEEFWISPEDDTSDRISLVGEWLAKIERDLGLVIFGGTALPGNTGAPYALYDAAIAPLAPYTIKGFLWYQGANDSCRTDKYRMLQTSMIKDWRRLWGDGDLPFGITIQAGSSKRSAHCTDPRNPRSELREAQIGSADDLPFVGLASAVDVGDEKDGHPKNKKAVGERLCMWALRDAYGYSIAGESPRLRSATVEGNAIRVSFHHAGKGLCTKAGTPAVVGCCAVAGTDKVWHDATGTIDGRDLLISSPDVPAPRHARYAWTGFPDESANLENDEGLPALPFRTGY